MIPDFYLSHPTGARQFVRHWELVFESVSGLSLFNPFYDQHEEKIEVLDSGATYKSYNDSLDAEGIVLHDLGKIQNTKHGTIVIIPETVKYLSYGTPMEMVYSKIMNKKVYSVIANGYESHPWLKYHSDRVFNNLRDLEKLLKKTYGKGD